MMFLTVFMFPFKGVKFYKKFPLVLLLQQISSQLIFDISYLLVYGVYQDMSKSGWSHSNYFFLKLGILSHMELVLLWTYFPVSSCKPTQLLYTLIDFVTFTYSLWGVDRIRTMSMTDTSSTGGSTESAVSPLNRNGIAASFACGMHYIVIML